MPKYKQPAVNVDIRLKQRLFAIGGKHGWSKEIRELITADSSNKVWGILQGMIESGRLEAVKEIAKELPQLAAIQKDLTRSHIFIFGGIGGIVRIAIKHGWSEIIRELAVASSSDVACEILEAVMKGGHLKIAKELLQTKAIKKAAAQGSRSCCSEIIEIAIKHGWSEIIRELELEVASSFHAPYQTFEILKKMIECGDLETAKELLQVKTIEKYVEDRFRCREIVRLAIKSGQPEVFRGLLQIDLVKRLMAADGEFNQEITRLQELETVIKLGSPEGVITPLLLKEKTHTIAAQGNYLLTIAVESEHAEAVEALLLSNMIATDQIITRNHLLLTQAVEKGYPGTILVLMKFYKQHSIELPTNSIQIKKKGAEGRSVITAKEFYTDYSLSVNQELVQYFPKVLTAIIAFYCDISTVSLNTPKSLTPLFSMSKNKLRLGCSLPVIPLKPSKPQPAKPQLLAQVKPKRTTTKSQQSAPEIITCFLSLSWGPVAGDSNKMRSNKMPLIKAEKFKEFLEANVNPYHFTKVASGGGTFQFEVNKKVLHELLERFKPLKAGMTPRHLNT